MQKNFFNIFFYRGLWILAALLITLYFMNYTESIIVELPRMPFLIGTIVICFLYIIIYRRNDIFCYETIFFILFVLSVYFRDIVLDNLFDDSMVSSVLYTTFPPKIENAGVIVQSLSLIVFLLGAARINNQPLITSPCNSFSIKNDFTAIGRLLGIIEGGYIAYLFFSGLIFSWFQYSGNATDYSNANIVYLTTLFLVHTSVEFARLNTKGCNNFNLFFKNVNKVYFIEISLISIFLLLSGNRNECLLILLPMIIAYSIFIKHITNKVFWVLLVTGASVMVFIGVTRQIGVLQSNGDPITLFESTRDFGFIDNNTKYLIETVEKNGPIYFKNTFLNFVSAIPFLGGLVVYLTGLQYDIRSTDLTTDGMQLESNMDSGLGTSLVGDLYYTGGFWFTILFMYFFGVVLAKQYRRFMIERNFNIWSIMVYLFMFSNVVYYIRAEWTMPIRYIGFSFVIYLVLKVFVKQKNSI